MARMQRQAKPARTGFEGTPRTVKETYQGPRMADPKDLELIRPFQPRNHAQREALLDFDELDLTFLIGPAGTGKTVLPVIFALQELRAGRVDKVVAIRPAIEAGDSIGFLTGDLNAKMYPYLRPVIDNFEKFIGKPQLELLMRDGLIEITSLTYIRGRTVENAVYIMDEMQNATVAQLRMCLTRIGENCKAMVTMDPSQIDLPDPALSAAHDLDRFRDVNGIAVREFTLREVVRSQIVRTVLQCYD